MKKEHPDLSVRRQCSLLSLARSTLYYQPRGESAENPALFRDKSIMDGLSQLGTTHPNNTGVLTILARWYPRQMLFDVLSLLKADYRGQIKKSPIKAYVYLTHVEAHKRGKEWINDCGPKCRHRPENRLPLDQLIKQT